ncbi:MAG: hypothetical protein ACRCU5_16125, partial [Rhizobiaceae bacterium]
MPTARSFKFLSTTALFVLLSSAAHAEVDAKKVVDAISAQMAGQGLTITVEASELSGANVIAKGVSVKFAEAEAKKIGDVVLENVTENGTGFLIGKIAAPATSYEEGTEKFEFSGASLNNVSVAGPDETDPVKQLLLYESFDMGPLKVSTSGAEVFRMEGAKATMSPYKPGEAMVFDAAITGLYGDLSKIPDPASQEVLKTLGYTEVNGTFATKGSWNPTDGRMTITEGAYDFKDVGRLNMTMDLSGYTPELVKGLQEMNKNMAGQDESAKGLAMLGMLQQLNFISMSIRFDDASITGRVLDYAAKQQGQDKAAMINQSKAIIPFMLASLKDPEF